MLFRIFKWLFPEGFTVIEVVGNVELFNVVILFRVIF